MINILQAAGCRRGRGRGRSVSEVIVAPAETELAAVFFARTVKGDGRDLAVLYDRDGGQKLLTQMGFNQQASGRSRASCLVCVGPMLNSDSNRWVGQKT